VAKSASLLEKLPFIQFVLDRFSCGLYPDHGVAASFITPKEAMGFLDWLVDFLNDICERGDSLKPNYKEWNPSPILQIFRLLPQTNCRSCCYPSCLALAAALSTQCLAFAAAVFKGQRQLIECAHLEIHDIEHSAKKSEGRVTNEQEMKFTIEELKTRLASVDLCSAARKLGASFSDSKLTIKILGKNFSVDSRGDLTTDIHIHRWVTILFSTISSRAKEHLFSGKWAALRELKNGETWYRLFEQRCEKPLKRLAAMHTELFEDMIRVFNGKQV
jgi:ArsR family metal-binding transcriptional regulator